jgi:hypothetical protein
MAVGKRGYTLSGFANVKGPRAPDIKPRLRAVVENPTNETREDTYALLVRSEGMTLWRAVVLVDPTSPHRPRRASRPAQPLAACAGPGHPGARDPLRRQPAPESRARRVPNGAAARPLSGP